MCSYNPDFSRRIPLTEAWSELCTLNQKQTARFHHRQLGENTYLNYSKRLPALRNPNFTYSSVTVITLTCTLLISDLPTLSFPPAPTTVWEFSTRLHKKRADKTRRESSVFFFFYSLSLSLSITRSLIATTKKFGRVERSQFRILKKSCRDKSSVERADRAG